MPCQLVKRFAFGVLFATNDGLMFFPGDGALVLELDHRPALLGQHRPRQPVHIEREVVDAAQIDVRGDAAFLKDS